MIFWSIYWEDWSQRTDWVGMKTPCLGAHSGSLKKTLVARTQNLLFKKKWTSVTFPTRSWRHVFLLVVTSFFHSFPVFLNFSFLSRQYCESRGLFYLCMGVFFLNPKINSMHTFYMYERCKMFVLFELYWNRSLNVILKKFENLKKIRWCK